MSSLTFFEQYKTFYLLLPTSYLLDKADHLFRPFVSPEEQGHGAGAGMAADDRADGIDEHLAVQLGESRFHQFRHRFGVFHIEYGDSDDFTAGFFQSFDLADCRFDIFCFGVCHRLDDYFILTADLNTADLDRPGFCSFHTFIIKQKAVSDAHSFERQCIHR